MKHRKIHVVGGCYLTSRLFTGRGCTVVPSVEEADLVVFTGGADVSPNLYGQPRHQMTYSDSTRDMQEIGVFARCQELKKPTVGICRGGQFLNVMGGGEMYQHVSNHGHSHNITDTRTGEVIYVSSTHHQMMKPSEDAIIIAVASMGGTREWFEGDIRKYDKSDTDIEVVYYKETNSLCFQPHPEYDSASYGPMKEYFFKLIEEFLQ